LRSTAAACTLAAEKTPSLPAFGCGTPAGIEPAGIAMTEAAMAASGVLPSLRVGK